MSTPGGDPTNPSPILKTTTMITTYAVQGDGTRDVVNETKVEHQKVEHLTGIKTNFLDGLVKTPSPLKRAATQAVDDGQTKKQLSFASNDRGRPQRAKSPSVMSSGGRTSPAVVPPSLAKRLSQRGHTGVKAQILLTGGVQVTTMSTGAQQPHGQRQIMGFVELDLVDGIYQGKVANNLSYYKSISRISTSLLSQPDYIDWEQYADPGDLHDLSTKEENQVASKKIELVQQLRAETEDKPEVALIYHVQSIVEKYLTRGRHDKELKYHVLLQFLKDCAPAGMSVSNMGFKIVFDYPLEAKDTLAKFEALRKNARP